MERCETKTRCAGVAGHTGHCQPSVDRDNELMMRIRELEREVSRLRGANERTDRGK